MRESAPPDWRAREGRPQSPLLLKKNKVYGELRKIDVYPLGKPIESGATGRVVEARNPRGKRVAVKIITLDKYPQEYVDREVEMHMEAMAAEPGVVPLLDFGEAHINGDPSAPRFPYIVMEPARESLRQVLRREIVLSENDAVVNTVKVAKSLIGLHEAGIVHGDVKPGNVLVAENDTVWLADFAAASRAGQAGNGYSSAYAAPEQEWPDAPRTSKVDQYALAVVLFEQLVGKPPFKTKNEKEYWDLLSSTDYQTYLAERMGDLPPQFHDPILMAMDHDPRKRFATIVEFADAVVAGHSQAPFDLARTPITVYDSGQTTNTVLYAAV